MNIYCTAITSLAAAVVGLAHGWYIMYPASSASFRKEDSVRDHSESCSKRNKNQVCMDRYAGEQELFEYVDLAFFYCLVKVYMWSGYN